MENKEFEALRAEIIQWQDKRFIVFNGTIVLLIAYFGWMIKNEGGFELGWDVISIFPIAVIAIAAQMNRIFEMYVMKIGTFIQVFLDSEWETLNDEFSVENTFLKIGLNRAYSILYLIIGISSTLAFYAKFEQFNIWTLILFIFVSIVALITLFLLSFRTDNYRDKLVSEWIKVKKKSSR